MQFVIYQLSYFCWCQCFSGVYEFQRTPDEVAKQWRAITELDDGTTYEVRLVLTDGKSPSTSSIQTVRTLGVGKYLCTE